MVGKKPTSYNSAQAAHKSHNSHVGGGSHCTEEKHSLPGEKEHRGSITNRRQVAWDTGVLDLREPNPQPGPGQARALLGPTASSRPVWAPTPSPACCSLEAGGGPPSPAALPPTRPDSALLEGCGAREGPALEKMRHPRL